MSATPNYSTVEVKIKILMNPQQKPHYLCLQINSLMLTKSMKTFTRDRLQQTSCQRSQFRLESRDLNTKLTILRFAMQILRLLVFSSTWYFCTSSHDFCMTVYQLAFFKCIKQLQANEKKIENKQQSLNSVRTLSHEPLVD